MLKHPKELGFRLGLKVLIGRPACISWADDYVAKVERVVYVALLPKDGASLTECQAIKVGQTTNLKERWEGICRIFKPGLRLRKNVKEDRRRWLKAVGWRRVPIEIWVWFRKAGRTKIPYAKGLTLRTFSTMGAEEEFLDDYYQPKIGKRLNGA